MRPWFGGFKRQSIIVSKSVERVNLTIALFASPISEQKQSKHCYDKAFKGVLSESATFLRAVESAPALVGLVFF